jgi:hypothetical protein
MRCWYTRWQLSSALDRGELSPRMARGHTASCASCQAFGRALASLHDQLARDAHTAAAPAPILRRPRARWLIAGPLAAGAAAAIALSLNTGSEVPTPPPPPPAVALNSVRNLADRLTQALASSPLETELSDLIHDGKRGLGEILAAGGLPAPR